MVIIFLFISLAFALTAKETLEMKMQCRQICFKNKQMLECEKACFTALEHRMKNFPNLPEQLKKTLGKEDPVPPIVNKFVKPGRTNNIIRR